MPMTKMMRERDADAFLCYNLCDILKLVMAAGKCYRNIIATAVQRKEY